MNAKVLILSSVLAICASPVFAQTVGTVNVIGSVESRCQVIAPDTKTINVGEMTGNTGVLNPATINNRSETLSIWCNQASASMEVEAQPLINTATAATGFSNRVDYLATATLGAANASDTSTTPAVGVAVPVGLSSGNIAVVLTQAATSGGPLLIAGAYNGRVLVTLRPNGTPPAIPIG
jgi:hypothetical protein